MEPLEINASEIPSLSVNCTIYPQGPFITGCSDIMIGKGKDGSFIRLFYPTRKGDIKDVPVKEWSRWYLGKKYLKGVGLVKAPHVIPLYVSTLHNLIKKYMTPSIWEAPVANSSFPLVIFSHGLLSNRNMSSGVCSELASFGFVVAAVEHRDGSACTTFTFSADGKEEWIFHKLIRKNESQFEIRKQQVEIRTEECSRVLDIMKKLNSGTKMTNEFPNSKFDLGTLKDKLDLSNPIIAGHSFGGATAILTAGKDQRFKLCIPLDPWMYPINDRVKNLAELVHIPMFFILMERFQTDKNIKQLKYFQTENNEFISLSQGTHAHMTDLAALFAKFPLTIQRIVAECDEASCSPEILGTIISSLTMKFLFKNLDGHDVHVKACDRFLAKYNSKMNQNFTGRAKNMVGWDY